MAAVRVGPRDAGPFTSESLAPSSVRGPRQAPRCLPKVSLLESPQVRTPSFCKMAGD